MRRTSPLFDARVKALQRLMVVCHGSDAPHGHPAFFGFDPGKLVVTTRGADLRGPALMARLRDAYRLELEMASADYAVAMTSVCDGAEAFEKLSNALTDLDGRIGSASGGARLKALPHLPTQALPPGEAERLVGEALPLQSSDGRIALEYVWAYPPGVPFLVPGELVDTAVIEQIKALIDAGVIVRSTTGGLPGTVYCAGITRTYL